jgi:cytochrome c oxidase subunit II
MKISLPLFPEQASSLASQVDALYFFLIGISGFFSLLIAGLVIVFAVKYRRRSESEPAPAPPHEGAALEIVWSVIPLGISMIIFVWGASLYFKIERPPDDALEIYVVAKQWMWELQHMEGQREINELHVPVNRDIKLIMTSQDVIHSFFIPEFRIKMDVLPGRYTTMWFRATRPGTYHLFCSQYCGTMHSGMTGQVVVMEPAAYQAWMSGGGATGSLADNGKALFQQLGCSTCHRFDVQGRGPNLIGVFGKPVQLEDGRTVIADENYVRESILVPAAKVVSGFKPIMPVFQGQVSEEQLNALVAYVKSLAQAPAGTGIAAPAPASTQTQESK